MRMELIIDLDEVRRLATARRDEFEVMRYTLELIDHLPDEEIDKVVDEVAQPIVDAIDCKQCANCCRSLDVYLTPDDAARLADGIDVPLDQITTRSIDIERASSEGEWGVMRGRPCPFLRGSLCSVYTHRPETCRTYPAMTPDFRWTLEDSIKGAALCPIIYNVLSAMVEKADELSARDSAADDATG